MKNNNMEKKDENLILEMEGKIERKIVTEALLVLVIFLIISAQYILISNAIRDLGHFVSNSYILVAFLFHLLFISILIYFIISHIKYMQSKEYEKSNIRKLIITENRIGTYDTLSNRFVLSDNIEKIKFKEITGGTGSRILIWPKDYDILSSSGFEIEKGLLEYYKKNHKPVIISPPIVKKENKKEIRRAIEEFKMKNSISTDLKNKN